MKRKLEKEKDQRKQKLVIKTQRANKTETSCQTGQERNKGNINNQYWE